jgi:hypothetical protein
VVSSIVSSDLLGGIVKNDVSPKWLLAAVALTRQIKLTFEDINMFQQTEPVRGADQCSHVDVWLVQDDA